MLSLFKYFRNSVTNGYVISSTQISKLLIINNCSVSTSSNNIDPDSPIDLQNPYEKEKVKCILCEMDLNPNYKNVRLLSQFQSPYTGRIYGRHLTGLCTTKQEQIETEIIKAQGAGLMPVYHKAVEFLKDPKLFDPERPIRPHKY